LVFAIGGITFSNLLEFMILIVVTALFVGSIGIFFSTLFKKTTAATVSTYGTLLFLGVGTLAILWAITIVDGLKSSQVSASTEIYNNADVGNWILILLINPGITCLAMIEGQIGTGSRLTEFFRYFGNISNELQNNWFFLSILVQLGISILLIFCSAKLLDPLCKICHRKNKN